MLTDQEQIEVFKAGWAAMKWLAQHAKTDCPQCRVYHRLVNVYGRRPDAELDKRCALARRMREDYVAVEKLLKALNDDFECTLIDRRRPDIRCDGPAEWALAERSRRNGQVIGFVIGCEPHVRHAEARAVVTGSAGTFTIEKLESVVREGAEKMR